MLLIERGRLVWVFTIAHDLAASELQVECCREAVLVILCQVVGDHAVILSRVTEGSRCQAFASRA